MVYWIGMGVGCLRVGIGAVEVKIGVKVVRWVYRFF
jgi:hypothetical protein